MQETQRVIFNDYFKNILKDDLSVSLITPQKGTTFFTITSKEKSTSFKTMSIFKNYGKPRHSLTILFFIDQ